MGSLAPLRLEMLLSGSRLGVVVHDGHLDGLPLLELLDLVVDQEDRAGGEDADRSELLDVRPGLVVQGGDLVSDVGGLLVGHDGTFLSRGLSLYDA